MISVLCPTRGRPRSVLRLLQSLRRTAVADVEAIFYLDEDDPELQQAADVIHADEHSMVVIGPRIVLSKCWNRCWDEATGDIGMQCGDDIRFRTPGWDAQVEAVFRLYTDRILLAHGDDGFQHGALATHGFLHRRWVETVGEFVPGIFTSDFNDTWLTEVADALGRRAYLPDVVTEHLHPAAGKGEWDRTHRERLERHRTTDPGALYAQTAGVRDLWVRKLSAAIETAAEARIPTGSGRTS